MILLVGLGLLVYPSFSNYWNKFHQSRAIMQYNETASKLDTEKTQAILDAASAYNQRLAQTGINWNLTADQESEYNSLLNADGSGIMGYINIPKIDVELPIYHGTDDAVLQTSIGHLSGTSLPVGGEGTHCVLSGHRGLPSARLFTDLDQLKEGDTFTMTVLTETLTYQVDQIRIVEPTDLSDLQIIPGQDLCTLVTCTPYGINTHRLLVRGHRIPNVSGEAHVVAEAIQIRAQYVAPFIAIPVIIFLLVYVLIATRKSRKTPEMIEGMYLKQKGLKKPEIDPEDVEESVLNRHRPRSERKRKKK